MSYTIRAAAIKPLSIYTRIPSRTWSNRLLTTSSIALVKNTNPDFQKTFIPKDPYLLSEKIVKLSNQGKLDEAISLVKKTRKGLQSDVAWNLLIQEKSKLGKAGESWQLLSEMKKRGFVPNSRTYTILLNSLAINPASPQSVSRATAFYEDLKNSEDLDVTVAHTNALLKVCSRKLDYSTITKVYKEMPTSGVNAPDVITFNTVINAFVHMKGNGDENFKMAWEIWQDYLEAKKNRPDEVELDKAIVDSVLMACRAASSPWNIRRGFSIVESLYDLSSSSTTPATVNDKKSISALSPEEKGMNPGRYLGIGAVFKDSSISPRTVDLILSLCMKLTEYNRGKKYLDNIYKTFPDFKPDAQLVSIQMLFQINTKDYKKATESWDQVKELGLKHTPATFKQGLDASYRARDWEKTMEMYREMRRMIKENKKAGDPHVRPSPNVVSHQDAWSLTSVLKCAVKTNHYSEAIQILHESKWTNVIQSPTYPRANQDLAELAVKVYSTALKEVQDASMLGEKTHFQMSESALKRELEKAQDRAATMKARLEEYDAKRAQREQKESDAAISKREDSQPTNRVAGEGEYNTKYKSARSARKDTEWTKKDSPRSNARNSHNDNSFGRTKVFKREVF